MAYGILEQYDPKARKELDWNTHWDNIQANESIECDKMYIFHGIKEWKTLKM